MEKDKLRMSKEYYKQWEDLNECIKNQDNDLDIDLDFEEQEIYYHNCLGCDECLG